ncbi:MAG: dihydroorotase [Gammaproteobacteria bacterium]|jgi:dihydroorotase
MRIRISKGRIIDPANAMDEIGEICISEGKIISVSKKTTADFTADLEIDASEKVICPGLIDLCARLREPGQEHKATIKSESHAAISSGITSICCPPDTQPVVDTAAVAELIQQRAESVGLLRLLPLGALTHGLKGEHLAELLALKRAGCVGVSNAYADITNTDVLRHALEYAYSCNMTVFIQAEDHYLKGDGIAHEGAISTRLGLSPIPETAETVALSQALLLIEQIGGRAHFGRLSCARSIALIKEAKKAGLPVSADVGICHLHLTEMDVDAYNVDCHLRPPLRSQRDKEALCQGIVSGDIDAICSDHQPHDNDAKAAPFAETAAGASTIELLLPLVLDLVDKKIISLANAIASVTCKPAAILGLDSGTLSPGRPADIAIIDLQQHFTVERGTLKSAGKNTPFHGWELQGLVTHALLGGRLVYQGKK